MGLGLALLALACAALAVSGLAVNVVWVLRAAAGRPLLERVCDAPKPAWSPVWILVPLTVLVITEVLVAILERALWTPLRLDRFGADLFLIANSLIRDVTVAVLVVALVVMRFKQPVAALGVPVGGRLRGLRTGVEAYVAAVPWVIAGVWALTVVTEHFKITTQTQPIVEIYMKRQTEPYLMLLTLLVAVLGPVIEEIFFRGFIFGACRGRRGFAVSAVLSAAIFALLHLNVVLFFPIFLLGIYLAWLYERTGSLVPSMTVHALHNLVMILITLGYKSMAGAL